MKNKVIPKTLSGFMELSPEDQILFNNIKNTIIEVYESFGYYPLDTPIIEDANVLLAKAGGETEKQIYSFKKGNHELALRFDLTVPLAKYVSLYTNNLNFPFKRYQIGKVYRGERPQKGRYREFYQCDIDVIGNETLEIEYESEIPFIIYTLFKRLNFGKFVIRINNRKILTGFFEFLELENKVIDIIRIIDKFDKVGIDNVRNCLIDIGIKNEVLNKIIDFINIKGNNIEKINKLKELDINNDLYKEGVRELDTIMNNLLLMGVNNEYLNIDLTIARGFDYYTGVVYETNLIDYPELGSICSGGRYESLAQNYSNISMPGVGMSIGLTRLFSKLLESNIIKPSNNSSSDIIIIPLTKDYKYIYNVVKILQKQNLKVDVIYTNKLKKSMNYANKMGVNKVIIIGSEEIDKNSICLKDMNTSIQEYIKLDNLRKEDII